jgi:hypothetical protein
MSATSRPSGPARGLVALVAALLFASIPTASASAQDRLVGLRAVSGGAVFEQVRFGDTGLLQGPLGRQDSLRVTKAAQFTIPLSAAMPLGRSWTLDLTTVYSTGEVSFTPASGGAERTASLSGISDVRVRTMGRFFDDALILTLGVNAPTGRTELDALQLTALRVLAAPALALGTSALGAGPSGTVGLLSARQVGSWAVAAGIAYEYRGTYQPVSALVAGAPSADFQPGGVIRASLGLDRLLGKHRLTLSAAGDLYQADELRGATAGAAPLATVQLGPVLSADAQLQLGVPRLRELTLWSAVRYRSNYSRDDVTVDDSNGLYLDAGLRTAVPLARRTDFVLSLDGRYQSGLAIDEGITTAGVTAAGLTLGFSQRAGNLIFQPFARGTLGSVQARGNARDSQQANYTGFAGGLVIISRF